MRVRSLSSPEAVPGATSTLRWHSRTNWCGSVLKCGRFSSAHVEGSRLGCSPSGGWSIGFFRCEESDVGSGGRISGYPSLSRPRLRPRSESTAVSGRNWSW